MIKHFRHAIEETLPWLSSIGADPTGGMTRLLYSPEWLETQQQFKKRMAESGLETRFDDVGNLYGRLCGTQFPEQVILSGSHIDTVVNGGNLDGQFGALAAWLALDWLKATYGAPLRTVEVVSMAEEEGSRFLTFFGAARTFLAWRILKRYAISRTPKAQALSTLCRRADLPFPPRRSPREPISAPLLNCILSKAAFWRATDSRLASSTPSSGNVATR